MLRSSVVAASACLILSALTAPLVAQPAFIGIGDLPGGSRSSTPYAVSSDGTVVVGVSKSSGGDEAFRWSAATGIQGLGTLPGALVGSAWSSRAWGVSGSGSVVVGAAVDANGISRAFYWTASAGMTALPLDPPGYWSEARNISDDGLVVVGRMGVDGGTVAFRWSASEGVQFLTDLPPLGPTSDPFDLSADGTTIVGSINSGVPASTAFRWNASLGLVSIPGTNAATGVSRDGAVIVGTASVNGITRSFRWTHASGMQLLTNFAGGTSHGFASDVSADGAIIVGFGSDAFVWTEEIGMVGLQTFLTQSYGLNLSGWNLHNATAISPDGNVIVGNAKSPLGGVEGFVARLGGRPPCPGNANTDDIVDLADITAVLANWNASYPSLHLAPGDANRDTVVNFEDINAVLANWLAACP